MAVDTTYPPNYFQRHQDGSCDLGSNVSILGTQVTATAAQLNSTTRISANASRLIQIAKVALAAVDTGGGVFSWQNPEGAAINIVRVDIEVDTVATGACSIDVGITATSATTQSDNLIDGLDIHSNAGVFTTIDQAGALGLSRGQVASGKWVTGSKDSGASAGIVGSAFIYYYLA